MERGKMEDLCVKAYGKINLGLDVIGRRDDGYHSLRMVMQTVGIFDEVTIKRVPASGGGGRITVKTGSKKVRDDESNLAFKAAKILFDEFKINDGVYITINKSIPVAAGMAGGSADCAAVLKGVNRMFDLGLSRERLADFGLRLGADVPFCVFGGTCLAEGIGERLTRLAPPPAAHVVIAKPGFGVSTKHVFNEIDAISPESHPDIDAIAAAIENGDLPGLAGSMANILEEVTERENPEIGAIKRMMKENGALGALMTGSGPTVFGLFAGEETARAAAESIAGSGLAEETHLTGFVDAQDEIESDEK